MADYTFYRTGVNPYGLNKEITAAVLPRLLDGISHVPSLGIIVVHAAGELPAEQQEIISQVIAQHDPTIKTEEQIADERKVAAKAGAENIAAAIPGWAHWTETEVLAYIDGNVTDLASAKVVLKALARMVVALRNAEWPHLEAGG